MGGFRPAQRLVELGLWLVAAICAFWALLWILGTTGFQRIGYGDLPRWLDPISLQASNSQWVTNPTVQVRVDASDLDNLLSFYQGMNQGYPDAHGAVPRHWGELLPGGSVVQLWDFTLAQKISFIGVQLAGYAGIAFIAITLARLVADSRGESPFANRNVGRLRRIGAVVLVGAPLLSLGHWVVERWLVESSSMGDRVSTYGYHWSSLPWWTMLVGAAVLVLADAWHRGVQMADDVEGLM